jgi:hypothetical protein
LDFLAYIICSKSFLDEISEDPMKADEQKVSAESYELSVSHMEV